jgi:hypothetical protein
MHAPHVQGPQHQPVPHTAEQRRGCCKPSSSLPGVRCVRAGSCGRGHKRSQESLVLGNFQLTWEMTQLSNNLMFPCVRWVLAHVKDNTIVSLFQARAGSRGDGTLA